MEYPRGNTRRNKLSTLVISIATSLLCLFGFKAETDGKILEVQQPAHSTAIVDLTAGHVEGGGNVEPSYQDETSKTKIQDEKVTGSKTKTQKPDTNPAKSPEPKWTEKPVSLLDVDSLDGWELLNFGGEGDCEVEDGVLTLEAGDPFTGVSSTRDNLPKTNYEISLTARKVQGIDFFCGLTFPVAESHCTLIVGGWGGGLVGLSCIDDLDASRNDTQSIMKFEKNQWYKIRVRVEPEIISAWIDDKRVVNQNIVGKKVSLRGDVTLCTPLGICSFQTDAEIKELRIRRFKPVAPTPPKSDTLPPTSNPDK